MANVIEFPSQRAQGLSFLEKQIRELLRGRGADKELMDFAAETTRRIYERSIDSENYSFEVTLPAGLGAADQVQLQDSIREGVNVLREENHAVVVRLIAELVMAEVRLFQSARQT
ncbi:MAG: hypothetical protein AAGI24_05755 [Pseudomonadota bacterium]